MNTKQLEGIKKIQNIEEIHRSMIGRISGGLVSIDIEGYFTYINNKAGEIFKRKPGSILGKNIRNEFPELLDKPFGKCFEKALDKQEYVYLEIYDPIARSWVENHFYPSPDGVTIFFIDVTEQKKRESTFIRQAKRNALILDLMQNSFILTDAALNILDVNPAFCKLIGYSRNELLKMNVTDFDVLLSEHEIKRNLNRATKEGIIQLETKNKKKNGEIIDVEIVLSEMEIDGQYYFASFGRDITESKKAKEQIITEKELSYSIINSLPGIFYMYDESGKFLKWNKNFEIISKYNSAEIATMKPLDFYADDEKQLLKEKIDAVFEKGTEEVEANLFTKDKEKIPYYFNGRRSYIDGKPCLVGMGIDISERKKTEESLRVMEKEILNQKVQEQKKITREILKTQETERNYIGRELHDNVNQILAGAKLYLGMAAKKDETVKKVVKYPLELIDSSINEIRLLTSKNVTPVRNINLKVLIQKLVNHLNKNTTIKTNFNYIIRNEIIDDELKLNIYRIVQEQVNNIIKHAAPLQVEISLETVGNSIKVVVTDDGKGFDVNKRRDGIGITNMINRIDSFNGKIDIVSSPGNGSNIRIEIPYIAK